MSDIISALKWIKANAAAFGGDASRITIAGQSAGGRMIEAIMRSPAAEGLYHSAIIQSGRPADAVNDYLTAEQQAGDISATMNAVGCGNLQGQAALTCLNQVSAAKFTTNTASFKNFTLGGNLLPNAKLDVARKYGSYVASVPVIFGWQLDEAGALGYVAPQSATNFTAELIKGGMRQPQLDIILSRPDLFPSNAIQTTVTQVQTDFNRVSRCGLEATAFAAAQSGVFPAIYTYTYDQRGRQLPGLVSVGNAMGQLSFLLTPYLPCRLAKMASAVLPLAQRPQSSCEFPCQARRHCLLLSDAPSPLVQLPQRRSLSNIQQIGRAHV